MTDLTGTSKQKTLKTSTQIKYLKGVGEKRAAKLSKLGIFTVGDLIYFFPRAYDDRSKTVSIAEAVEGEVNVIRAAVCMPAKIYSSPSTSISLTYLLLKKVRFISIYPSVTFVL